MSGHPLKELARFGVSVWYDDLSRGLLESGELSRLVAEDGVTGLTSNPTIFANALSSSHDYDETVRTLAPRHGEVQDLFEAIAIEDIRAAADILQGVYKTSAGRDGFVSIELPPELAQNAKASHAEALRLFHLAGRPNVMIKIPGTAACLEAVTQTLADGVPVNITLLFSRQRYGDVVEAYLKGLELRASRGKDLASLASVASFFVSRVDTAVDQKLKSLQTNHADLLGQAAVANAKLAYGIYKKAFSSDRFSALKRKGAKTQRLLWASTGVKNPATKDTLYVEELIGPDTVNTMPPATLRAFADHGLTRPSLEEDAAGAGLVWERLQALGIDPEETAAHLEAAGLEAFQKSYTAVLRTLTEKKEAVLASEDEVEDALKKLTRVRFASRLWSQDASLWKTEPAHQAIIRKSLGWLTLPDSMAVSLGPVRGFAEEIRKEGFEHAVVLGMGGSSLACEVLRQVFGKIPGHPVLEVLDSTNPAALRTLESRLRLERTLFFVSSKSGSTIEPHCLMEYFFEKVSQRAGDKAGRQFAAITDPGSSLAKLAVQRRFRKVFLNPPDVGGRFSALSLFGLVPAAVMGVDLQKLLNPARACARACAAEVPPAQNPALRLGAALGLHARQGKDKLTLSVAPELEALGLWIEQLVAESTGKEGRGILPVHGESLGDPSSYGQDRLFVRISLKGPQDRDAENRLSALEQAGHPVLRLTLVDRHELGAQFFLWEMATAAAGFFLQVDPFDQPDVQSAKTQTQQLLGSLQGGTLPKETADLRAGGLAAFADKDLLKKLGADKGLDLPLSRVLTAHLGRLKAGDYCAILAYVHPFEEATIALESLQKRLRQLFKAAVTVQYGPRYLHSTGQLYKGGGNNGLFLELVETDGAPLPIPQKDFSFGVLHRAQAKGDYAAMLAGKRRILRLDLGSRTAESLRALANACEELSPCPR